MDNELVVFVDGKPSLSEQALEIIHQGQIADYEAKKAKINLDILRDALTQALGENGIKTFDCPYAKITYKAEQVRKIADTDKLKEQGLFDLYSKESKTKATTVISFKDFDD